MLHAKVIDIKKEKIKISNAEKFIASNKYGASIYFVGTVRDLNNNKNVIGMTYDTHDKMVVNSFEDIYQNSIMKFKFEKQAVFVEHIKGKIPLGEISILIALHASIEIKHMNYPDFLLKRLKRKHLYGKKNTMKMKIVNG